MDAGSKITSLSSLVEIRGPPWMLAKPLFGLWPPDLTTKVSLLLFKTLTMAATSWAVVG